MNANELVLYASAAAMLLNVLVAPTPAAVAYFIVGAEPPQPDWWMDDCTIVMLLYSYEFLSTR